MNRVSTSNVSTLPSVHPFANRVNDRLKLLLHELSSFNEKASRGKIHDLRIYSRRLRATLQALSPFVERKEMKRLKKIVQELTQLLGPVRSLDVSQSFLKKRLQHVPEGLKNPFEFFFREIRRNRKRLRKKLARTFKKNKIFKALRKLVPLPVVEKTPLPSLTEVLLQESEKASRRLLKSWRRFEKKKEIIDLHEVRIELKKWRYLLELQAEYTGSPSSAHLGEIKKVQERLGHLHDAEVLRDLLKEMKKNPKAKEPRTKKALKNLMGGLKSEIADGLNSFHREGEGILLQLFSEGTRS